MTRKRLTRVESRQQTRGDLLAAAARLFAERGVNGTSVEQIAESAGYSRGAFYGNFADKHQVVAELLAQRTQREPDEIGDLAGSPDPYAALRSRSRNRAEHLSDWLTLRIELLLHAWRSPEFGPQMVERERVARQAHYDALEQTFAELDISPPTDLSSLALLVHALEDGLLIQRMMFPDEVDTDFVVGSVELLVRTWTGQHLDSA